MEQGAVSKGMRQYCENITFGNYENNWGAFNSQQMPIYIYIYLYFLYIETKLYFFAGYFKKLSDF